MREWPRQPAMFDFFDWCLETWWRFLDWREVRSRSLWERLRRWWWKRQDRDLPEPLRRA